MPTENYLEFRRDYPDFYYRSYDYALKDDELEISYHFEIGGLTSFNPKWKIARLDKSASPDKKTLERLVFSLGMVELVSYWKATCSPCIHLPAKLDDEALHWWKKLYLNGLGEFFYRNGIEYGEDVMKFVCEGGDLSDAKTAIVSDKDKVLVPVGGGKDSVVTLEILKNKKKLYCYAINPKKANNDTVRVAGLEDRYLSASRTIDRNLLDLNSRGFLNGHTPFSAIVAFSGVLTAYLNGMGCVALSNESSANESTVAGTDVNHQYSKSYEFEKDFSSYEEKYLKTGVGYFSFLRPLLEIRIAEIFSRFKDYFPVFRSCNLGSKTDVWCCNCAKCLFVYIILSPFLKDDELIGIFGENLLDSEKLEEDFKKLLGLEAEKPFECVGERSEVLMAMNMLIDRDGDKLPCLVEKYRDFIISHREDDNARLCSFDKEHSLPSDFEKILIDFLGDLR